MSTTGVNPLIGQGELNRVITHIVVAGRPDLSVSASFMAKSLATLNFEDEFVQQIGTATGVVNSREPYVMANIEMNLLRSQSVAGLWIAQARLDGVIGQVTAYPDSTVFPAVTLVNCAIRPIAPGAYDGTNPEVKITLRGVFYANAVMWA